MATVKTEKEKRRNQQAPRIHGEVYTMLTIGDRIRYLRELRQMKQVELATECGLTQAALSNLETDPTRKPSSPTLLKIADVLEANPEWILTGVGEPHAWAPVTSPDQVDLLRLYKRLSMRQREEALAFMRGLME